jgi:hypothetical protein
MKKNLFYLLLFLALAHTQADEIDSFPDLNIGDNAEQVVEHLGEPTGYMETEDYGIYYFELGSVHMKDGKVSSMNLISHETLVNRREAKAGAREANRIKGEKLLASIKEDDLFSVLPAEDRLSFWEKFRQDYPDVDVYVLYTTAKIEAAKVVRDRREEERLVSLERRVFNAEREAERAKQAAQTQRLFENTRSYNSYPRVVYLPSSYVYRRNRTHYQPSNRISTSYSNQGIQFKRESTFGISGSSGISSRRINVLGPQGTMETGTYLNSSWGK